MEKFNDLDKLKEAKAKLLREAITKKASDIVKQVEGSKADKPK